MKKQDVKWTKIGDLEWSENLGEMNWKEAVKKAEEIGGRVPEMWEIQKALKENYEEIQKLIKNDDNYNFWSATESSATNAWGVNMFYGFTSSNSKSTTSYQVRCVRVVD